MTSLDSIKSILQWKQSVPDTRHVLFSMLPPNGALDGPYGVRDVEPRTSSACSLRNTSRDLFICVNHVLYSVTLQCHFGDIKHVYAVLRCEWKYSARDYSS